MRTSVFDTLAVYPEDNLSPALAKGWRRWRDFILEEIIRMEADRPYARKYGHWNIINLAKTQYIEEVIMARDKSKRTVGNSSDGNRKPDTFKWVNISLTDEDGAFIGSEETTLEFALSAFVELVARGVNVSLKYNNERREWTASIYKPSPNGGGVCSGVSGFSSDVRFAVIVVMYKYIHKLGGDFPAVGEGSPTSQQFR